MNGCSGCRPRAAIRMRLGRELRPVVLLLGLILTWNAVAEEATVMDRFLAGGHVLMIRHALAPGSGDPPEFALRDCATQRNLDARGREQAVAIGEWLRQNGLGRAAVFSSQWCRCLETARLMDVGDVEELPALNSFYEQPQNREPNLRALRTFLGQLPADGPPVILVTHFVTIAAISGSGVGSGEGVMVELGSDGGYAARGRLSFGF